jgi:hypothetical protein
MVPARPRARRPRPDRPPRARGASRRRLAEAPAGSARRGRGGRGRGGGAGRPQALGRPGLRGDANAAAPGGDPVEDGRRGRPPGGRLPGRAPQARGLGGAPRRPPRPDAERRRLHGPGPAHRGVEPGRGGRLRVRAGPGGRVPRGPPVPAGPAGGTRGSRPAGPVRQARRAPPRPVPPRGRPPLRRRTDRGARRRGRSRRPAGRLVHDHGRDREEARRGRAGPLLRPVERPPRRGRLRHEAPPRQSRLDAGPRARARGSARRPLAGPRAPGGRGAHARQDPGSGGGSRDRALREPPPVPRRGLPLDPLERRRGPDPRRRSTPSGATSPTAGAPRRR